MAVSERRMAQALCMAEVLITSMCLHLSYPDSLTVAPSLVVSLGTASPCYSSASQGHRRARRTVFLDRVSSLVRITCH
jgi:hypothetical protein